MWLGFVESGAENNLKRIDGKIFIRLILNLR